MFKKLCKRRKAPTFNFSTDELLGREIRSLKDESVSAFYQGKRVLVTGGGGSIGSELVRRIAECSPRQIVIFDIYENNAYDLLEELKLIYGDKLCLTVEIGSVQDKARLDAVFSAYKPEIVFHAAAHKHVPLMEHSPTEAVKNNCFGTYLVADAAEKHGAEKFVLVSTDKAVNPTNVMGASKRVCEMIVQCRRDSKTIFCAVRFGNVLGSNGSVIPLFKRQILSGGPVTVTDKRVVRYFMTIREAVDLLTEAGAFARAGELLVLDMGEPVRIYDLAVKMIKLAGLVPFRDVDIVEVGLRPGEKLYEEALTGKESQIGTESDVIFVERDTPLTREEVDGKIRLLKDALAASGSEISPARITEALKQIVPTFHSPHEVNKTAKMPD